MENAVVKRETDGGVTGDFLGDCISEMNRKNRAFILQIESGYADFARRAAESQRWWRRCSSAPLRLCAPMHLDNNAFNWILVSYLFANCLSCLSQAISELVHPREEYEDFQELI